MRLVLKMYVKHKTLSHALRYANKTSDKFEVKLFSSVCLIFTANGQEIQTKCKHVLYQCKSEVPSRPILILFYHKFKSKSGHSLSYKITFAHRERSKYLNAALDSLQSYNKIACLDMHCMKQSMLNHKRSV